MDQIKIVAAAYESILRRWDIERKKLMENPENRITQNRVAMWEKKIGFLVSEIVRLEKGR